MAFLVFLVMGRVRSNVSVKGINFSNKSSNGQILFLKNCVVEGNLLTFLGQMSIIEKKINKIH